MRRGSGDRLRVLHVVPTLDRAGTEMTCHALMSEFAKRGIDNHVVALTEGGGAARTALARVAHFACVLPPRRLARAIASFRLCRSLKPDAVIMHYFTIDHLTVGAAARLAGIRKLVTKQGNPAPSEHGPRKAKVRFILSATRFLNIGLVCSSQWIQDTMAELGRLPEAAHVIHNGVDVRAMSVCAAASRAARPANGPYIVGMIARLDPIKDHATLLAAFARLPAAIGERELRLRLIGDGLLRASLPAQARRLGIASRVEFLGERSDTAELLGDMDVFVFSTTREEGFGVALAEALAAGVPVIASDVPPCREVLAGGLGELVAAGNAVALAQAIEAALHEAPRLPQRSEIERRYGMATMADGHQRLIS